MGHSKLSSVHAPATCVAMICALNIPLRSLTLQELPSVMPSLYNLMTIQLKGWEHKLLMSIFFNIHLQIVFS